MHHLLKILGVVRGWWDYRLNVDGFVVQNLFIYVYNSILIISWVDRDSWKSR